MHTGCLIKHNRKPFNRKKNKTILVFLRLKGFIVFNQQFSDLINIFSTPISQFCTIF